MAGKAMYEKKKAISLLPFSCLFTKIQFFQNGTIPENIAITEVIEQPPAFTNQPEKCTLGGEVFFADLQVLSKVIYPVGKQGNLTFSSTGIGF